MKAKIFILYIALITILGCSKKDSETDKIILSPTDFNISLKNCNSNSAEIEWTKSTIKDKSKILYDIYLDNELISKDYELYSINLNDLKEKQEYQISIIAKSIYDTELKKDFPFTTLSYPTPENITIEKQNISTEEITVSWNNNKNLKYDIYLNDIIEIKDQESSQYTFKNVKGNTKYKIKIVGKNIFKKTTESIIEITTPDYKSPENITLTTESVSANSATIKWEPSNTTDNNETLSFQIVLNNNVIENSTTNLTYVFTNLDENTEYTATIIATNQYGKSTSSNIKFITSVNPKPSDFLIDISSITTKSATISWNRNNNNPENTLYSIYINDELKKENINTTQILIDNLESETTYTVKIVAKNEANKTFAKEKDFKTLVIPTLSDFTIRAEQITQTSVVLRWTECIANNQGVFYTVYHPNGATAKNNISGLECKIDILKANTAYKYKVVATSNDFTLSKEQTVTFTTPEYEKPSDFDVSVNEITETTAKLSWTNSTLSSGEEIKYSVYINNQEVSSGTNESNLTRLSPNTDYTAKVVAISPHNTKTEKIISFKTKAKIEYQLNLSANNIKQRSMELSWDFSENPDANYYEVFINGESVSKGISKSKLITDLSSDTDYRIKLIAKTANGEIKEKEITERTISYPVVNNFDINVIGDFYNKKTIDISDFKSKNSIPEMELMYADFYLNGEKLNTTGFSDKIDVTNLNPLTKYNCQISLKYPDKKIAYETNVEFTTEENIKPQWSNNLEVKNIGFGYVEFNNIFAEDTEPGSNIVKYTYYVNNKALNGAGYIGNARGDGQIDQAVNKDGNTIILSHIESNKEYEFYIEAEDQEGAKSITNKVTFKTSIDAKENFTISPKKIDENNYTLSWEKMGNIPSIKEVRIKYNINGLDYDFHLGNSSCIKQDGTNHYIELNISSINEKYPDAKVYATLNIYWIDKEPLTKSTSAILLKDNIQ